MLATTGPLPAGPGWAYEFKWDGVRAIADVRPTVPRGCSPAPGRRSPSRTRSWRRSARAWTDALLDGEMVVLDEDGRPSFAALAERMHVRDRGRAARLAATPAGHLHDLRPAAAATAWT